MREGWVVVVGERPHPPSRPESRGADPPRPAAAVEAGGPPRTVAPPDLVEEVADLSLPVGGAQVFEGGGDGGLREFRTIILADRREPCLPALLVDVAADRLEALDGGERRLPEEERGGVPLLAVVEGKRDRLLLLVDQETCLVRRNLEQQERACIHRQFRKRRFDQPAPLDLEDLCNLHAVRLSIFMPPGARMTPSTRASSCRVRRLQETFPRIWASCSIVTSPSLWTSP